MKKRQFIYTVLLLFTCLTIHGQTGNTQSNPIVVGTYYSEFNYSNSQNTTNFTNDYTGRSTGDVYYRFTLSRKMEVTMRHCGSTLSDTYLSLLDASGNLIAYNDDYSGEGACSSSMHSYLKRKLDAGTYYVVSEGYSSYGVILTQISGTVVYVQGDSFQDPIVAGTFDSSFLYSDTQNTANFSNRHVARNPNDIFYRFTLNRRMIITLTHCGSALDTYMHLLDTSGNTIASNDNYSGEGACSSSGHSFIQRTLEAGTYYIVSEGYSGSGLITTRITGSASDEFNYPDIPNTYSSEPETVGSAGGAFGISPTGGATYSIPVEVPPGVGGLQPSPAIIYNSQSGNGIAGWGCSLSCLSAITRTPKDIYHDDIAKGLTHMADEAYLLDGQRLILSSGTPGQEGAVYYPESDPFTKVTVHGTYNTTTANTWFEVEASNGMKYYYGNTSSGRQSYTSGSSPRINAWYLDYAEDPIGNYMTYTYYNWNYFMYPNTVTYGMNKYESTGVQHTVSFGYESRSDIIPFIIEGVKGQVSQRLKTITCKTGNSIYRSYDLQYDASGDGSATKFSRLTSVTEKNAAGEALRPVKLQWSYLPTFSESVTALTVNAPAIYPTMPFSDQQFMAADLNGDGLADIIGIAPVGVQTNAYVYWASLDTYGNVKYTGGTNHSFNFTSLAMFDWIQQRTGGSSVDFNGDGRNDLLIPHVNINSDWQRFYLDYRNNLDNQNNTISGYVEFLLNAKKTPLYATGDFNNNGKTDFIYLDRGILNSGKYQGKETEFNGTNWSNNEAFELTLPSRPLSIVGTYYSKPEKMFVSDYNGDGLEDLLVFYKEGYTIFWNQGNGITASTFSDTKKTTGTNIGYVWMIRPGDFNGDGLTDFLMNETHDSNWYFALNNGDGTFSKQLACTLGIYDQDFTDKDNDKFDCLVYDFDSDGKSDVVITKAMYTKKQEVILGIVLSTWGEFNKTYTYWMRSTGNALAQVAMATSNREEDAISSHYILGDFNGDGQIELMNYGYNCYSSTNANVDPVWRMYRNSNFNASRGKVTTITDGYGATTTVNYASLANGGIYTKGTGSAYPVADYTVPIHAVKTVTEDNGAASIMTTSYQYSGLKVHLQGKGLMGMTSQTVTNSTLGTVTESGVKTWNDTFHIPSGTYTKTTMGGNTAETNVTLTIVDKGSKKYFSYPSSQTDKDLDGNTVTTTRLYNTVYGYQTEETADFGNNMYKKVQYENHILAGKTYKPGLITKTQKHTDDAAVFSQKTSVTYNTDKGYRTQVVENYGSSLPLTTDYTYDTFGNLLTSRETGSGITPVVSHRDYDASKRFVAKTYTSPASSVTAYTHDTWGNVLTVNDETNPAGILTTTHTYDNWGNLKSTILPDGRKTTYQSGWNNSSARRFFTLMQETGQPWVKTWYDNRGREVLVETVGAQSMTIRKSTIHNSKGLVARKQVQAGNLTTTENFTYDSRGRVASANNSAGQNVTYTYGNRSVTTLANGRTCTKTYDAWGGVKTSTDPVSTVTCTYKSLGKPQAVTTGGATFSMTYYDTGDQHTLTDPNAGTFTYTYDAAGRITRQVNGRGKTTVNTYDALGRISVSSIDGIATSYTYGTSGNELLRLTRIQTSGNSVAYTHDTYGRILTETRQVEEARQMSISYSYNTSGQLDRITYPGSVNVNRQYDAYGNLQKVTANSQTVWELTGATGTVTTTRLGGTLTATQTCNAQGLLTGLKTVKGSTVLHNINYTFNGATGNLSSRRGMVQGEQEELFLYDRLDRLTIVQDDEGRPSMEISYEPNGNIHSKTGLGQYSYNDRPHTVNFVENPDGLISCEDQTVNYTAFDRVSAITERAGADNYRLDVTYGPDRQRWKTTLKKNSVLQKTIIFAGDYERITENGVTKQLFYISGGDGPAAIFVRENFGPDKIYYICKDHLGSIMKLVDADGTEVFRASYDAWGKQTVTNSTFAFHRGYTGHEHLPEFNLINMNGRMYDPVLGRFLSPDPFVQATDFSQSYNRYSYCLNNPLKYTDPTGEFAWMPLVFFALQNGLMQGGMESINGGNFWEGFARGAIISAATSALTYGVGEVLGHAAGSAGIELARAGAHGVIGGSANAAQGGNFWQGFAVSSVASLTGSGMQAVGWNGDYLPFATGMAGAGTAWATGGDPLNGFMQGFSVGALNHKGEKILGDDGKTELILGCDDVIVYGKYAGPIRYIPISEKGLESVHPEFDLLMIGRAVANSIGRLFTRNAAKGGTNITKTAIKGFTEHGTNQAVTRGFKTSNVLKIVREGNPVEAMGRFGPQTRYTLGGNTVVVNAKGEIISVFSNAPGTANGLGKGFFIPFE